jgi:hypothetical protein
MNDQQSRDWRRWVEAEQAGEDDTADAIFGGVFRASAGGDLPSAQFTAVTMAAVAEAAGRDARRARRIRAIGWPVAIVAAVLIVYTTAGLMMSAFSAIVIGALNLLVSVVVKVATAVSAGGDVWSIAGSLGRAIAAVLASPSVTTTILALQGIAVAALIALQRLLRSDRESFR